MDHIEIFVALEHDDGVATLKRLSVRFWPGQSELSSTLDVKAKLEERLDCYAKETALLKKKADDYSNEVRCLILKVR